MMEGRMTDKRRYSGYCEILEPSAGEELREGCHTWYTPLFILLISLMIQSEP
jgi:hypothetical protein